MLVVDYQSKSYRRFLSDMTQIADHKTRFFITFNGANADDLSAATADLTSNTNNAVQHSTAITDKDSSESVTSLFHEARNTRSILLFEKSDVLFHTKMALKNSHEREIGFDINNLFKNIAKHNGVVILATESKQTLSATMSTKIDVVIRFPTA